ncbi:hypothetical protein ERJ75_000289300 [Trypanosoma vivax]|nr:hypothetical protein ERJ75_000289300 [Trypanosoma vivax]
MPKSEGSESTQQRARSAGTSGQTNDPGEQRSTRGDTLQGVHLAKQRPCVTQTGSLKATIWLRSVDEEDALVGPHGAAGGGRQTGRGQHGDFLRSRAFTARKAVRQELGRRRVARQRSHQAARTGAETSRARAACESRANGRGQVGRAKATAVRPAKHRAREVACMKENGVD